VVSYKYANIKTFTVKLEVTDVAGNKANATKSLVITSQPRPDLRIVSVKADPNPMTEGSTGKFIVNVTNVGNDNAYSPSVTVSILNSDGSKSTIGTSNEMTNIDNDTILPGKYGLFEVSWTPSGKGNYTIVTKASVENEITTSDNTYTTAITVNEATWKAIALYGGIFAVIVVIIVLYYYRKRLPKLGGGKKEKEKAPTKEESKKQPEERKSKK